MSDYIELRTITSSSSEDSVFNKPSTSSNLRHRGGYTTIPIASSNSSISSAGSVSKTRINPLTRVTGPSVAAGSQYQHIFEGQLGSAASDPNNPLSRFLFGQRNDYYASVPSELKRLKLSEKQRLIKPYGVDWNKDTKAQYPEHWRLVNPRKNQKKIEQEVEPIQPPPKVEPLQNGVVLPFSNNIGPGNPIRPATNRADLIAQGHDIHYQQAKGDSDVLSADREAISQFAHEAVQGSDPISRIHAAVGGIGLGVKHTVERLTGKVFYGKPCLKVDHWVLILRSVPIGTI